MPQFHTHSEQKYIEKVTNGQTGEEKIKSYCLICGEKVHEVVLKDSNKS